MLKFLIVRPGATEYDQQGRIQGTLDVPLCEDGREQVLSATGEIKPHKPVALYCGPGEAAQQSAEVLGDALRLKAKTLDKLHNLDYGLWQGMLVEDVQQKQPKVYRQWQEQPLAVRPPEGETVMQAIQRTAGVLKKLLKKHAKPRSGDEATGQAAGQDEVVVIVASEPIASVIRHIVLHDELGNLWKSSEVCGKWELIQAPPELVGV